MRNRKYAETWPFVVGRIIPPTSDACSTCDMNMLLNMAKGTIKMWLRQGSWDREIILDDAKVSYFIILLKSGRLWKKILSEKVEKGGDIETAKAFILSLVTFRIEEDKHKTGDVDDLCKLESSTNWEA
jgi:hypothetical protein